MMTDRTHILNVEHATALDKGRPFMLLRPRIYIDGNMWCALYGDNLQDGVAGFGETPDLASRDFDRNWLFQKPAQGDRK